MPISEEFKDIYFDFKYNVIDAKKQVKYNQ